MGRGAKGASLTLLLRVLSMKLSWPLLPCTPPLLASPYLPWAPHLEIVSLSPPSLCLAIPTTDSAPPPCSPPPAPDFPLEPVKGPGTD